ncbi:MAG: hypothetical protein ACSLE0_15185 [Chitinophagaceae bacterium]
MFYEELYTELGKLFYFIAARDGKVRRSEKESLQLFIQNYWKPFENSTDKYGTDLAFLINFSFDFEETEGFAESGFESFEKYYRDNKSKFSKELVNNILLTGKAIATSYRGKNKEEKKILD